MTFEENIQQAQFGDIAERAVVVYQHLVRDGYYHLAQPTSEPEFNLISEALGEVIRKEDVKLYLTPRSVHKPKFHSLHTDHVRADLISWWCVEPETRGNGGPTLMCDGVDLLQEFSGEERELLKQVKMNSPWPGTEEDDRVPFLVEQRGRSKVFYTPWRMCPIENAEAETVWKRLQAAVARENGEQAKYTFGVVLKKGECLFLDNRRMIHGRTDLPSDSQRCLRRLWISSDFIYDF